MASIREDSNSESVREKLEDEIEGEEWSSSSDSDSESPSTVSRRKKAVHAILGGGKPADILLWRNKHVSASLVAGVTVTWFLFERLGYNLLVLVSHCLMLSLGVLFIWSKACSLIHKSPPRFPVVHFQEDAFVRGSLNLTGQINQIITYLQKVALGRNLNKFLMVVAGLWVLSVIGSWCSFLTLFYIVFIVSHTVPVLYERHGDHVDCFADKALVEIEKQYNALDEKFLKKLPRVPLKIKKQH